jgi:iron complex transport system substrate-binding protein
LIFILLTASSAYSALYTDLAGRQIEIRSLPEKVIPLGPGTLRLMAYLNVMDKVFATERVEHNSSAVLLRPYAAAYRSIIAKLPEAAEGGPYGELVPDRIKQFRPDLIVATGISAEVADKLQAQTGTPVVILSYSKLGFYGEEFFDSLHLLGDIFSEKERVEYLSAFFNKLEKDLSSRSSETFGITAYLGGHAFRGAKNINSTESNYFPFNILKIKNVAGFLKKNSTVDVDRQKILNWNPEYVFIDSLSLEAVNKEYGRHKSFYLSLGAVKSGKVYTLLPNNYYNVNVENLYINAYFIGKVTMPDSFADVNLPDKADEIYFSLFGKELFFEIYSGTDIYKKALFTEDSVGFRELDIIFR